MNQFPDFFASKDTHRMKVFFTLKKVNLQSLFEIFLKK